MYTNKMNTRRMNDLAIVRARELAELDQLEALLLDRLKQADQATERRALNVRLRRVERLRAGWRRLERTCTQD